MRLAANIAHVQRRRRDIFVENASQNIHQPRQGRHIPQSIARWI
jgi:hypothetical protein